MILIFPLRSVHKTELNVIPLNRSIQDLWKYAKKISNTLSFCSQEEFDCRISQLTKLNEIWMQKKEIGIQLITDDGTMNDHTSLTDQNHQTDNNADEIDLDIDKENFSAVKEVVHSIEDKISDRISLDPIVMI